jgi:hypothetical protein
MPWTREHPAADRKNGIQVSRRDAVHSSAERPASRGDAVLLVAEGHRQCAVPIAAESMPRVQERGTETALVEAALDSSLG